MSYHQLPGGGVLIKGDYIARQNRAIESQKDRREMFTLDAVRGAHIAVERLRGKIASAPEHEHDDLKAELVLAEDRLAKASAAHVAYEKGETEGEPDVEPEPETVEPEVPEDEPEAEGDGAADGGADEATQKTGRRARR